MNGELSERKEFYRSECLRLEKEIRKALVPKPKKQAKPRKVIRLSYSGDSEREFEHACIDMPRERALDVGCDDEEGVDWEAFGNWVDNHFKKGKFVCPVEGNEAMLKILAEELDYAVSYPETRRFHRDASKIKEALRHLTSP